MIPFEVRNQATRRDVVKVSLFYLPGVGTRQDVQAGMAGTRADLYQQMLQDVSAQARLADELGYDSISFTEHHLHIEGFEVSNNPVLLDLYVAMQTKRIRVGQLGIVLPANNPLRVAEDIAMLDHMTHGRANAGFARGYQRRWVDIYAQQTHGIGGALPHQHDDIDATNREAFEENFRIVKAAWAGDLLDYQGKYWQIPRPGTPWDLEASRLYGRGSETGRLTAVGVVPKPLQTPHPPIFQPFASSENSIRWCAREGVTAILPPLHPKRERALFELYATESGRRLGDGIGYLRDLVIADSDAEARSLWRQSAGFVGGAWFAPFGFGRGLADPDTGVMLDADEMMNLGLALVGTPDMVARQLERMRKRLPVEWIFTWMYNGVLSNERLMSTIEQFARLVR
jgi:alkanesulfonate monooxygenase SsuD/methylene tetrahydromethanopterin reductase-like flavin-dependent oxidoreductase (luciferase family)